MKPSRPDVDLVAAFRRVLGEEIIVHENGIKRKMKNVDLIASIMLRQFPKATIRDQLAVVRWCLQGVNPVAEMQSQDMPPETAAEFIQGLIDLGKEQGLEFDQPVPPVGPTPRPK